MIKRCSVCKSGEVKPVGGADPATDKTHTLDICDECGQAEGPFNIEWHDDIEKSKHMFYENASKLMVQYRLSANMTQGQWAKYLGIDQPGISRIENGQRKPTLWEFEQAKNKGRLALCHK